MEGISIRFNRDINCLREKDKNIRLNALKHLSSELPQEESSEVAEFFTSKLKDPLLEKLSDPTDRCKELTVSLLSSLIGVLPEEEFPFIIEALFARLGIDPVAETCEEIRVSEIGLLSKIIESSPSIVESHFETICRLLGHSCKDHCPEVKIKASQSLSLLAKYPAMPSYSKDICDLLKRNLSHQQFKVRLASLQAIGDICTLSVDPSLLGELKKVQFDRRNEVKDMFYEVIYNWLMVLPIENLAEVEGLLLYYLLGGYVDNKNLFEMLIQVGDRLNETEDDGVEFVLVKNLKNLIDNALGDIQEWTIQDIYRSRAISVMIYLAKIVRNAIEPHFEGILKVFIKACVHSEDMEYTKLFYECVYHIALSCSFYSIFPGFKKLSLSNTEKAKSLDLLAVVIESSNNLDLGTMVDFLTNYDLLTNESSLVLNSTHECFKSFIVKARDESANFSTELFYALLVLESYIDVEKTVEMLAECCGLLSASEMYATQLPVTLPSIIANHKYWEASSSNRTWFRNLVIKSGLAVAEYFSTILEVLTCNSAREKDSEVRYDMLVVTESLLNIPELQSSLSRFMTPLIEGVIVPAAAWKIGVSSIQVRIGSMVCLELILSQKVASMQDISETWDKLFPVLKTCLGDDWEAELRSLALSNTGLLLKHYFDANTALEMYPEVIKRLDDSKTPIRNLAAEPLMTFFSKITSPFEKYRESLRTLFVQLDDDDVRENIKLVITEAMKVEIPTFLEVATEILKKHRHPEDVTELINLANSL